MAGLYIQPNIPLCNINKMKSISIVVFIVALVGITQSVTVAKSAETFFGTSDDWQNYSNSKKGIYIDIDLSSLNLANTPAVSTYLTCK